MIPTEEQLLDYIRHKGETKTALRQICKAFDVPYLDYDQGHGYSREAKNIRNTLQRLRKAKKIRSTQAQRWILVRSQQV